MAQVDINLTARDEQVNQPWIMRLCREFNLSVNIVKANVDQDFGWIQLRLEGPVEEIQRATAWLMQTGMHVDAEQRAVGAV
jgi:ABC-type methionine transport system ATPase subunit